MTIDEFNRAMAITKTNPETATALACLIVVSGAYNPYAAAKWCGVSASSVYRKIAALEAALAAPVCASCGRLT